jgi:hypothetical protein
MLYRSVPGEMMSKTVILLGKFVAVARYHSTVMLDIFLCVMSVLHMTCENLARFSFLIKFVIIIVTQFIIFQLH